MRLDRYDPSRIEEKWYRHWLETKRFAPSMAPGRESFCIVIPPPNVTGSLHMGHAWDETIQDILIRWRRMAGDNTLWIPGTDHAGIATQWMVEQELGRRGLTKEALGRERFVEEAWRFKEASHATIAGQLERLGVSCDWERERFTLDEGLSRAVRRVFVTLFNEGLIYRANRMVSWCPRCLTALSDLEVNHDETDGRLWHIHYPFADGKGRVTVATTRPETMLGDTAVAVHPEDDRYGDWVGRTVMLPLAERPIPVIADSYVDREFGSGALKITPAHDPNDFQIGLRHGLPLLNVMNENGTLNENAPEAYRGMDRFQARKKVLADLKAAGLLAGEEPHRHAVGTCSRCSAVIEPRVSLQWYVRMREMADAALEAVRTKRVELVPEFQEKIFAEWMTKIQDWCISRQLWWGHRIPVWYCRACNEVIASEAEVTACTACGSGDLEMEQDVLDTWFSSGLWPFSTMGWPEQTRDLATFYPTAVLVTGYDILFFWVARMIMLGIKFTGDVPFRQVFLHGLLRDADGVKMSKTKGNGIDPLEMIGVYGADALRFTLATGTVLGRDMILQESAIEGNRNFINKIWNATRFTLAYTESLGAPRPLAEIPEAGLGLFDRWILERLRRAAEEANHHLTERRFNDAAKTLYAFVWHELCDWYVEIAKPLLQGKLGPERQASSHAVLHHVLADSLKLLHPFMPFATEELWQMLPGAEDSIMVQPYPLGTPLAPEDSAPALAGRVVDIVQTVRTVRGENGVRPGRKIDLTLALTPPLRPLAENEEAMTILTTLVNAGNVTVTDRFSERDGYGHGVGDGFEVFLSLAGLIDVEQERQRIGKEAGRARDKIEKLAAKLENPAFLGKAPAAVVEKNRRELTTLEAQLSKLSESLERLPSG